MGEGLEKSPHGINMSKSILSLMLAFLLMSLPCRAGWVLGMDSDTKGMLKVFRNDVGEVVAQHCQKKEYCEQTLFVHDATNLFIVDTLNNVDLATGAFVRLTAGIMGGIFTVKAIKNVRTIGPKKYFVDAFTGYTLLGVALYGSSRAWDLIRLYDYTRVFDDDFLEDNDAVIVFPKDSLHRVLGYLDFESGKALVETIKREIDFYTDRVSRDGEL